MEIDLWVKSCKGVEGYCAFILVANFQRSSGTVLNRVKTDGRASLGDTRLNSLLRICMEGSECADFDGDENSECMGE